MSYPNVDAVIYARFSTDKQDARSLEDQERVCREHPGTRRWTFVEVYRDAAMSGTHENREDLIRMLQDAKKRPRKFTLVVVDDLGRLSRDLGAVWRLVFDELAGLGITVFDCLTGMASDAPGARLTYGAMALVNDTFIQLVRAATHRGLKGRAIDPSGPFCTGGKTFGYGSIPEEPPRDPEHVRRLPVVDEDEAKIVLLIFVQFSEGNSLKKIAAMLNESGIKAPHDGGRGHKVGRGWGHTTIRALLMNERYIGRWTWNTSRWVRGGENKKRRRIERPAEEHIVRDCPHLAIISSDLWASVQARFKRQPNRARPAGTGPNPYLITGLLRCGGCGGNMTIIGGCTKAGVRYPTYGCGLHYSRGSSICANNLTISEKKATAALVGALQDLMTDPVVIQRFIVTFEKRLAAQLAQSPDGLKELDKRIREAEQRVKNVTEAFAKISFSEALVAQLKAEEERLASLKGQRAQAAPKGVTMPDKRAIASFAANLTRVLETDRVRGREILARHLGPVVMTPEVTAFGRRYRMTGAFNIAVATNAKSPSSEEDDGLLGKSNSGGTLGALNDAISLPFGGLLVRENVDER